jgi:hypothetical protein
MPMIVAMPATITATTGRAHGPPAPPHLGGRADDRDRALPIQPATNDAKAHNGEQPIGRDVTVPDSRHGEITLLGGRRGWSTNASVLPTAMAPPSASTSNGSRLSAEQQRRIGKHGDLAREVKCFPSRSFLGRRSL